MFSVTRPSYHFSYGSGGTRWNASQLAVPYRGSSPSDAYLVYYDGIYDTWAFGTSQTTYTINGITVIPKIVCDRGGGNANINFLNISKSDVSSAGAFMVGVRASASGGAVQNGWRGLVFRSDMHDGTQYITNGYIQWIVDGAVGTGAIPATAQVAVMDATGTLFVNAQFTSDGKIEFNPTGGAAITFYPEGGMRGNQQADGSSLSDLIWGGVTSGNLFRVDTSADQVNIGTATQGSIAQFGTAGLKLNRLGASTMNLEVGVNGIADAVKVSASEKRITHKIRSQVGKGADVPSASTITLGDGNLFRITGTTTINYITTTNWQAGSIVTLDLASTPTLTHNAGSVPASTAAIYFKSRSNLVATAEDTVQLQYNGTYWKEI